MFVFLAKGLDAGRIMPREIKKKDNSESASGLLILLY
jgi:hypothetical protein